MKALLLSAIIFLSGCASVQDLSQSRCLPGGVPGDVTLLRTAYLYKIEGESTISLWDSPYTYGAGVDASGKLQMHSPPPLLTLPKGSRLSIQKVTRESHFDNPQDVIDVQGIAQTDRGQFKFVYTWGIGNKIHHAPWESATYDPKEFNRSIAQCRP
jgi:hypothetical protein